MPSADLVARAGANSGLGNAHRNVEKTVGFRSWPLPEQSELSGRPCESDNRIVVDDCGAPCLDFAEHGRFPPPSSLQGDTPSRISPRDHGRMIRASSARLAGAALLRTRLAKAALPSRPGIRKVAGRCLGCSRIRRPFVIGSKSDPFRSQRSTTCPNAGCPQSSRARTPYLPASHSECHSVLPRRPFRRLRYGPSSP
jgi:hypothetical protein